MAFTLPELQYAANSLEPSIDAKTMEIHHGKHHNAYVTNLNNAINGTPADLLSIEEICKNISSYPMVVRNNGGGHFNHSLFWTILSSNNGSISNELSSAIENDLGGMEKFKESFTTAATTRFGSGWAWLIVQEGGKLSVCSSPNQDNPIMDIAENKGIPILCLDVWEHAYYLNYQNRRPDYISSFWNIVNWTEVSRRFAEAIK
ncbi:MAG: superoxide dismutase [Candidatus Kapaibacterium sp.]